MSETTPNDTGAEGIEDLDAEVDRELAEALGDQSIEDLMSTASEAPPEPPPEPPPETSPQSSPENAPDAVNALETAFERAPDEARGSTPGTPPAPAPGSSPATSPQVDGPSARAPSPETGDVSVAATGSSDTDGRTRGEQDLDDDDHVNLALRRGRVGKIHGEDVFVDLFDTDGKLQGLVPLKQFERAPRIGCIMDFLVERIDESEGLIHLSREGAVGALGWDQMRRGSIVEARVVATNKGGLELELAGGIHGFMPASQIDLGHVDDLEFFVGQKLRASVQELNRRSRRVVLSRRRYLERERARQRERLLKELEAGQIRDGTITRVVDFGAFVDLGGIDGLLHITDMSYSRVEKPGDLVRPGQQVAVKVLKIEEDGKRIRLGLKQAAPDPWEAVGSKYHAGNEVSGRVVRIADFGAFVEVEPGVEALLPISEMSWKRIHKPNEVCKEEDVLKLRVLQVDGQKRRMSLSLKQVQGDPWEGCETNYAKHSLVEGTVVRTTNFGAFVEIETGLEGLVHISELADRRVNTVEEILKVGDTRQFRVLEVNPADRRISLSVKAVDRLPPAEEDAAASEREWPTTKAKPAKRTEALKGGMGNSGALGTGLGDLKL